MRYVHERVAAGVQRQRLDGAVHICGGARRGSVARQYSEESDPRPHLVRLQGVEQREVRGTRGPGDVDSAPWVHRDGRSRINRTAAEGSREQHPRAGGIDLGDKRRPRIGGSSSWACQRRVQSTAGGIDGQGEAWSLQLARYGRPGLGPVGANGYAVPRRGEQLGGHERIQCQGVDLTEKQASDGGLPGRASIGALVDEVRAGPCPRRRGYWS